LYTHGNGPRTGAEPCPRLVGHLPRLCGLRAIQDPRTREAKHRADNSTAEPAPRRPCSSRYLGPDNEPERLEALVPQRNMGSCNRYYVSLAGAEPCASAVSAGSPSFSSAGSSEHVSSQPRGFFPISETGSDRKSESGEKRSGRSRITPNPTESGAKSSQGTGTGGLSIPGRVAFSSCARTMLGEANFSLSGVGCGF
jgi:hypothetical protein